MKKGNFAISINDGNDERHMEGQEGWLINDWFACHKAYRDWHLTHLPTGMTAFWGNLRRRSDAQALAMFLTERADWSFTDTDKIDYCHKSAMRCAMREMIHDASYNRYEWPAA